MKRLAFLLIVLISTNSFVNCQIIYLKLINQENENKTRTIKIKSSFDYTFRLQTNVDTIQQCSTVIWTYGKIIGISKDSILLEKSNSNTSTYCNDEWTTLYDTIKIAKTDITKFSYRIFDGNPFTTIGGIALVSSVVVSPIISFDFKKGKMNVNKYALISGISSATSVISFSLISTMSRQYWIINKKKKKKKLWRIE